MTNPMPQAKGQAHPEGKAKSKAKAKEKAGNCVRTGSRLPIGSADSSLPLGSVTSSTTSPLEQ